MTEANGNLALMIERFITAMSLRLRPNSLREVRTQLKPFVRWTKASDILQVDEVTRSHIQAYRDHLHGVEHRTRSGPRRLGPRSLYDRLAIVQRFFAWLVEQGKLAADPALGVARGRRGRWQPRHVLSERDVERMIEGVEPATERGARDLAILELLYATGLRRAEIVGLDLADVDLADETVFVRSGKGGRQRFVPLGKTACAALRLYLSRARSALEGDTGSSALFLSSVGGSCARGRRLGGGSIRNIVAAAGERAGLGHRVTPHMLRHAVATHMLRAGADPLHPGAARPHPHRHDRGLHASRCDRPRARPRPLASSGQETG